MGDAQAETDRARSDAPLATGPVALAGSGEFLAVMEPVDRALLHGRPARAAFLPTAAALEGDKRTAYWLDLGTRHYESMGVEPVPVPVRTRADAEDAGLAALVRDVGLVYLSGGDPHYLSETLRNSAVWSAIVDAWRAGAALAGCSAGAMALTAGAPPALFAGRHSSPAVDAAPGAANGLGVVGGLAVVPHFDMIDRWRPGALSGFLSWRPAGTVVVGIDENTAIVGDAGAVSWRVEGAGAAWVFDGEDRRRVAPGETLELSGPGMAAEVGG